MRQQPTPRNAIALYARVSSQKQEQDGTIESQLAELHRRAAGDGRPLHASYEDNGYSGTTTDRPALDRMRDDARAGHFCTVYILAPDRLSRDPYDSLHVSRELKRHGVEIVYLNRTHDSSASGELMADLEGALAKYERRNFLDRTRRGKLHKVGEGHIWRGRTAFGYAYVKPAQGGKHGHMELVPEEAAIVRQVFDHILAGKSLRWVASELIRQAVPTRLGGTWTDGRVRNIIANPIYHGEATYGRWVGKEVARPQVAYTKLKRQTFTERPRGEWLTVQVPAVVTADEQARAQATLARNRVLSRRNAKQQYLLSGLLYCGTPNQETGHPCGRRLVGESDSRRPGSRTYRCTRQYIDGDAHRAPHCRGHVAAPAVEALVWDRLVDLLRNPDTLHQQMAAAQQDTVDERRAAEGTVRHAATALADLQAKLDRLLDLHLDGAVDKNTYSRKEGALVAQRTEAEATLRRAQRALEGSQAAASRWETVEAYCAAVAGTLEDLERPDNFARRQELVRTLVQRVVVYDDRIAIEGVLPCVDSPTDGGPGAGLSTLSADVVNTNQYDDYAFSLEVALPLRPLCTPAPLLARSGPYTG